VDKARSVLKLTVVSIVKDSNVVYAVHESIRLIGGIESIVKPGDRIAIKPNLVMAQPGDSGITTDPQIVKAIIELCQTAEPADIAVVEGSSGTDTKFAFEKCGYSELAAEYGINLVDLNESQTTIVEVPEGRSLQKLEVPNVILESDVLINVPKLKLYRRAKWASLAVKNLIGAVPGQGEYTENKVSKFSLEISPEYWSPDGEWHLPYYRQYFNPSREKKRLHENLSEGIMDLNTVIRPTLNIIDGMTICRDPDITYYDTATMELNTIIAGSDPLAVDSIAVKIRGYELSDIPYLKPAIERRLGESDYSQIQVLGTPLDDVIKSYTDLVSGSEN
jgi:uncharacterized protein (DUF362 family)